MKNPYIILLVTVTVAFGRQVSFHHGQGNTPFPKEPRITDENEPLDMGDVIHQHNWIRSQLEKEQRTHVECGGNHDLSLSNAQIQSPGWLFYYPHNSRCSWTFTVPAGSEIKLAFQYFDVNKGDYLMIGSKAYYGHIYDPFVFKTNSTSNKIDVIFQSNSDLYAGIGFDITLSISSNGTITTSAPTSQTANSTIATSTTVATTIKQNTTVAPTTSKPTTTVATTASSTGGQCQCGVANKAGNRIVGGQRTDANEYPWQVGLINKGATTPFCGGSLISDRHVLTAAHCTAGRTASNTNVLVGEHDITDNEKTIVTVASITNDPKYNSNNMQHDFAILTLSQPVTLTDKVRPVCLPADLTNSFAGAKATVSGWGTTTYGGSQPSVLMDVDVTVKTNKECAQVYGSDLTRYEVIQIVFTNMKIIHYLVSTFVHLTMAKIPVKEIQGVR